MPTTGEILELSNESLPKQRIAVFLEELAVGILGENLPVMENTDPSVERNKKAITYVRRLDGATRMLTERRIRPIVQEYVQMIMTRPALAAHVANLNQTNLTTQEETDLKTALSNTVVPLLKTLFPDLGFE